MPLLNTRSAPPSLAYRAVCRNVRYHEGVTKVSRTSSRTLRSTFRGAVGLVFAYGLVYLLLTTDLPAGFVQVADEAETKQRE